MAITAKNRARLALRATTTLDPAAVLQIVQGATGEVKGGGASLLTSGLANLGAQVHVEATNGNTLRLSITSGKRLVELCTFSAEATASGGKTQLRVGGLDTYKTVQEKLFMLIPVGPKAINGIDIYKRYLHAVEQGLRKTDAKASIDISVPE
jgi:hypothetical protein